MPGLAVLNLNDLNPKATAQPSNTGLEELKQLFICTAPSDAPFAADFGDAKRSFLSMRDTQRFEMVSLENRGVHRKGVCNNKTNFPKNMGEENPPKWMVYDENI